MINKDPDITRLLDRLEKRGFVTRSRDDNDRRVIVARITTAGLDTLRQIDRPVDRFLSEMLGTSPSKNCWTSCSCWMNVSKQQVGLQLPSSFQPFQMLSESQPECPRRV